MAHSTPSTTPVSIEAVPLGEGDLEGSVVTCPWHGWQFDVATGTCVANPSAKVEWYDMQVDGTDVKVRI